MLDISRTAQYVVNILREHGWYEEREYDITEWLEILSKDGYSSFGYAERILKSLGNIYVNVCDGKDHMCAQFNFDPLYADGHFDLLHEFEIAAQKELYPKGEMVQALAYVGKSKKVYWGDWKEFYCIGDSIEDYLNNLFYKGIKSK